MRIRNIVIVLSVVIFTSTGIPAMAIVPVASAGEAWLGPALVHTQTCAPGCGDRAFKLSVASVTDGAYDPFSSPFGDQPTWDFAPKTAITLRLAWVQSLSGGQLPRWYGDIGKGFYSLSGRQPSRIRLLAADLDEY